MTLTSDVDTQPAFEAAAHIERLNVCFQEKLTSSSQRAKEKTIGRSPFGERPICRPR